VNREIVTATAQHAALIAALKRLVWPDFSSDAAYIARVLSETARTTHLAYIDGQSAGFIDGFLTLSQVGVWRWEIDLLAVSPDYRSQGVASALIAENLTAGRSTGAALARALVRADNAAAQTTFRSVGFKQTQEVTLFIADGDATAVQQHDAYFVPVTTLDYRGVWLEGTLSTEALISARTIVQRFNLDAAGVLISESSLMEIAQRNSYQRIDVYHWWHYEF
jgi:ribosomal protein S18 acetylase RimI-like enzyme